MIAQEVSVSIKHLTLQSMCPTAIQEDLEFHSARRTTFKAVKYEIDNYMDVKIAGSSSPMDIDLLQGRGKGKKPRQQEKCKHCGKKYPNTYRARVLV
eukprot:4423481-Amphidinium_carterae.1